MQALGRSATVEFDPDVSASVGVRFVGCGVEPQVGVGLGVFRYVGLGRGVVGYFGVGVAVKSDATSPSKLSALLGISSCSPMPASEAGVPGRWRPGLEAAWRVST